MIFPNRHAVLNAALYTALTGGETFLYGDGKAYAKPRNYDSRWAPTALGALTVPDYHTWEDASPMIAALKRNGYSITLVEPAESAGVASATVQGEGFVITREAATAVGALRDATVIVLCPDGEQLVAGGAIPEVYVDQIRLFAERGAAFLIVGPRGPGTALIAHALLAFLPSATEATVIDRHGEQSDITSSAIRWRSGVSLQELLPTRSKIYPVVHGLLVEDDLVTWMSAARSKGGIATTDWHVHETTLRPLWKKRARGSRELVVITTTSPAIISIERVQPL